MKKLILFSICLSLVACQGKKTDNTGAADSSSAENAASAMTGAVTSSEGIFTALNEKYTKGKTKSVAKKDKKQTRSVASLCPLTLVGLSCSNNQMILNYQSCNPIFALMMTITGQATLTYNSNQACQNASVGGLLNINGGSSSQNSMTLTSQAGVTITAPNGYYVTMDSNASGYSQILSGGLQVTCLSSDCSTSPGRSVAVLGEHRALYSPTNQKLFDHTLSTTQPFVVTGTGANRRVLSGTLQLQHNLAKFIQTSTVTAPLTYSSNCCFPTGGQIQASYSNSSGSFTQTVTFTSSCGVADIDGKTTALTHCF